MANVSKLPKTFAEHIAAQNEIDSQTPPSAAARASAPPTSGKTQAASKADPHRRLDDRFDTISTTDTQEHQERLRSQITGDDALTISSGYVALEPSSTHNQHHRRSQYYASPVGGKHHLDEESWRRRRPSVVSTDNKELRDVQERLQDTRPTKSEHTRRSNSRRQRRRSIVFDDTLSSNDERLEMAAKLDRMVAPRREESRYENDEESASSSVRHTAPPNPRLNDDLFQVSDPHKLQGMVGEPYLRPALKNSSKGHRRETSRGSYHRDEERHLAERRLQDLYLENPEDKQRRERMQKKVARDNYIINSRPPVPEVRSVTSSSRSYRRPSVVIDRSHDLVKKMAELDLKEKRRQENRDRKAEEEQRQRLRDRVTPVRPKSANYSYSSYYHSSKHEIEKESHSEAFPSTPTNHRPKRPESEDGNYVAYPLLGLKPCQRPDSGAQGLSQNPDKMTTVTPKEPIRSGTVSTSSETEANHLKPGSNRLPISKKGPGHQQGLTEMASTTSNSSQSLMTIDFGSTSHRLIVRKHSSLDDETPDIETQQDEIVSTRTDQIDLDSLEGPPSLVSDDTISSMASTTQILQAIREFVIILTTHPQLQPLLLESTKHMTREGIEEQLTRLITDFAQDLKTEAGSTIEQFAAKLVRRRARMISHTLAVEIDPQLESTRLRMDLLNSQEVIETRSQIERYLEGLVGSFVAPLPPTHLPVADPTQKMAENDHDLGESGDEDDVHGYADELPNLNHLRTFMIESTAFARLVKSVTTLREEQKSENREEHLPPRAPGEESQSEEDLEISSIAHEDDDHEAADMHSGPAIEQPQAVKHQAEMLSPPAWRESLWSSALLQIWHYVSRPALLPGHQRITYTCGCGKHMYADVQELYPGGAKRLEAKLRRSAAAASSKTQVERHASLNMSTSAGDLGLATRPTPSQSSDSEGTLVNRATNSASATSPPGNTAPQDEMFLLLCVSNNRRLELEQLKIMPAANDQIMFQDIRRAYLKLRQDRTQQFHPKTPKVIQKVILTASRISTWTQSYITQVFEHLGLEWLVWWIGDNVFVIPYTANFVRFELVPIRTDLCPQILESLCLPPEEQVKIRNYHYMPYPSDIKNPALRIPYLHDLFESGIHLDDHWTETSPKKLRTKLHYTDSRTPAIGWGVHIVERTNWPAFAVLSAFGVVISFVAAVVFSAVCDDPSGGFTVGSFSITCFALLVSVVGAAASTHS